MKMRMHCNGVITEKVKKSHIEAALKLLKEKEETFIDLSLDPEPTWGPAGIQVEAENGYYVPSLLVNGSPPDVRALESTEIPGDEEIDVMGDLWHPSLITRDYALIERIVWEFFRRGNVSTDILKGTCVP